VRLLERKLVYSGWGRFLSLDIELSDGRVVERQVEDHGEAAAVLPFDAERRVALVCRQPRIGPLYVGVEPNLVEAAAGMIDRGEDPGATAIREALEELEAASAVRNGRAEIGDAAQRVPVEEVERCLGTRLGPARGGPHDHVRL